MKWFLNSTERIFRNWRSKLVFIIIAIIFAFIYQTYILSYKIVEIPLYYEINPNLSLLNEIPNSIPIKVKGRGEILEKISSKDFKATLDSQVITEEGSYSIPINTEFLLKDHREIQYSSEIKRINLTLEKTKKSLVEVIPFFSGHLKEGLEVIDVSLFPKRVIIEGPSSLVNLIQQIPIKPIDLSTHQESFSQLVEVDTPFNLKVSNKSLISVNVTIKAIRESIRLDNVPIGFINLSSKFTIKNFKEEGWITSSFIIKDKEGSLKSLENTYLIVDLSEIEEEGAFNLPVQILTQAEKQYISYGPHEISLVIEIEDEEK